MSRRLMLAAALLVGLLVAFSACWVIATWSPVEPLSFRVTRDLKKSVPDAKAGRLFLYEVEVKNTSAVDIEVLGSPYLLTRLKGNIPGTLFGSLEAVTRTPRSPDGLSPGLVPARGTRHCVAHIREW